MRASARGHCHLLSCVVAMILGCDTETASPEPEGGRGKASSPGEADPNPDPDAGNDAHTKAAAGDGDAASGPGPGPVPGQGQDPGLAMPGCPRFDGPRRLGTAPSMGLSEASGLGASPGHPGAWWTHNDSGAGPVATLLAPDGSKKARVRLPGASALDWEDLAVVRDAAGISRVYVADMGDNFRRRKKIAVHRFVEPGAEALRRGRARVEVASVELAYPDGAHDAEALLVDPRTLQIVIVTKSRDGHSGVYAVDDPFAAGVVGGNDAEPRGLERVGEVVFGKRLLTGSEMVTAGDVAPDGASVLLRTYSTACLFERGADESLADALARPCCNVPLAPEPQGEAISFMPNGRGYATISEGDASPIWGFDLVDAPPSSSSPRGSAPTEPTP